MSFLPWLGDMPEIDAAIQTGFGVEGAILGQPFDVFRLTNTTNVGIVTGQPLYTNFPCLVDKKSKDADDQMIELIGRELHCDATVLQLGDTLVPMTPEYGAQAQDIWTLVQKRPTFENIGIRTNMIATISRPTPTAGAAIQQPLSGNIAPKGWSGIWKESDYFLTLNNGLYSFTNDPTKTAAQVYIAIQPNSRLRDGNTLRVPTEQWRDQFAAWCPFLPGEFINELDRFNCGQGDRYQVAKFIIPDQTQFYGTIMVVEKLGGS